MAVIRFDYVDTGAAFTASETIAWVDTVFDSLSQAGFSMTSDTGQLEDLQTITTTNGYKGFRVLEWEDELSAECRILLRVEIWVANPGGSVGTGRVQFRFYAGVDTDGAGNLKGAVIPLMGGGTVSTTSSNRPEEGTYPGVVISYPSTGSVFVCLAVTGVLTGGSNGDYRDIGTFWIGRTLDSEGLPNASGLVGIASSGYAWQIANPPSALLWTVASDGNFLTSANSFSTQTYNGTEANSFQGMPLLQHPMAITPYIYPISHLAAFADSSMFTPADILEVEVQGEVKQFQVLGPLMSPSNRSGGRYAVELDFT